MKWRPRRIIIIIMGEVEVRSRIGTGWTVLRSILHLALAIMYMVFFIKHDRIQRDLLDGRSIEPAWFFLGQITFNPTFFLLFLALDLLGACCTALTCHHADQLLHVAAGFLDCSSATLPMVCFGSRWWHSLLYALWLLSSWIYMLPLRWTWRPIIWMRPWGVYPSSVVEPPGPKPFMYGVTPINNGPLMGSSTAINSSNYATFPLSGSKSPQ